MVTPQQLKRFRKRQALSREALAVEVGVSAQTIWRWEQGGTIPGPEQRILKDIIADHQRGAAS